MQHAPRMIALAPLPTSSITVNGLTAAQTIFGRVGIASPFGTDLGKGDAFDGRKPEDSPVNILIYGSSTSLGLYLAQVINLVERTTGQPIRLIGTASASRHVLLKQKPYNYDVLVDYRDVNWPEKVRAATGSKGVEIAMDCISEGDTVHKVDSTFGPKGGRLAIFRSEETGGLGLSNMSAEPLYGASWECLGAGKRSGREYYIGQKIICDRSAWRRWSIPCDKKKCESRRFSYATNSSD
ncbi:hypothetical protein F4814DRAFT_330139 [Daldinia grandis]|nr:hypothetical protein F4814DRAFT_330139 [Daldinia grandis]